MENCDCMFHDLLMQRLLSILRQSQAYCTDTVCVNPPRLPGEDSVGDNFMMMMLVILGVTALLYFTRPNSIRGNQLNEKARDFNDDPPAPPPALD